MKCLASLFLIATTLPAFAQLTPEEARQRQLDRERDRALKNDGLKPGSATTRPAPRPGMVYVWVAKADAPDAVKAFLKEIPAERERQIAELKRKLSYAVERTEESKERRIIVKPSASEAEKKLLAYSAARKRKNVDDTSQTQSEVERRLVQTMSDGLMLPIPELNPALNQLGTFDRALVVKDPDTSPDGGIRCRHYSGDIILTEFKSASPSKIGQEIVVKSPLLVLKSQRLKQDGLFVGYEYVVKPVNIESFLEVQEIPEAEAESRFGIKTSSAARVTVGELKRTYARDHAEANQKRPIELKPAE